MSLEDTFQNKTCICGHSIKDDHEIYPTRTACYALDFNGTIYSACQCKRIKVKPLIFLVERDETTPDSSNKTTSSSTTKSIKPSTNKPTVKVIQWGSKKAS